MKAALRSPLWTAVSTWRSMASTEMAGVAWAAVGW